MLQYVDSFFCTYNEAKKLMFFVCVKKSQLRAIHLIKLQFKQMK